ncbi:methyltransferase type 12 [Veronia nyctiphanis]|uniref:Methyltransferase type 12 n=1 Tax=Veronia nyctiphanis TaxID=1278244 RepID=A0A4Q0YNG9_9GAMM|nr:class I SAM-dependent methyltransferase [Veronia nyctiphanis]RXJ72396.1 methyltransferase type 12 [Veronia nyctiphanis]
MQSQQSSLPSYEVYTPNILQIYDFWVLGLTNLYLWKCPTRVIKEKFEISLSDNHLDVGVGSGYYLDECLTETTNRIGLLDANKTCLSATSRRISRFQPEVYQADVRRPLELDCDGFDSISVNSLLHGLPGTMKDKSQIIGNIVNFLNSGGKLFGSTVLADQNDELGFVGKLLMKTYNRLGIYANKNDTLDALKDMLSEHLDHIEIDIVGCVAVFSGVKKNTFIALENLSFPVSPFVFKNY